MILQRTGFFLALWLGMLATATSADGAPLAGLVVDTNTTEAVPGAQITAIGANAATTTTPRGEFKLLLDPGTIRLSITADGYEPRTEEIALTGSGFTELLILLTPIGGISGEVVEIIDNQKSLDEPLGRQELSRREITRIPGTRGDALTSVRSLPGVANATAGGPGPGLLVIRGAAPEDTKITIDGIEVPLVYHFFGLQSILPSEFIDRIDFLPGGFGVDNGRATGGVINIQTRNEQPKEWSGFAELSFINLAALAQGPISEVDNLAISIAVRRSMIDFILPLALPDDANLAFTTAPTYYDGQVRLDWAPNKRNRAWMFGIMSSDLLSLVNSNVNPNEPKAEGTWENETAFTRLMMGWQYSGDRLQSRVTTSLGNTGFRFEISDQNRFLRSTLSTFTGRWDASYRFIPQLALRTGLEGRYATGDVESRFPIPPGEGTGMQANFSTLPDVEFTQPVTDHTLAAYTAVDVTPTTKTRFSPGVRAEYYDRTDTWNITPRLLASQRIGDRWTVRGAVGMYTRPLQAQEFFAENLKPERATQYVLGGDVKIGDTLSASGSFFYTDRSNLVVQDPALITIDPLNSFTNTGVGRSFGGEALLKLRKDNVFGWISYTLSRSDRIDRDGADRRLFDFDQTHNFIALGSYTLGSWEFGARWQYSTGSPDTPITGAVYQADFNVYLATLGDINSTRIDSAHQLDIRIDKRWKFRTWDLSAYLDVTNVYAHPRVLGYRYNFDYTEREAIEELPIVPALGVRGSF